MSDLATQIIEEFQAKQLAELEVGLDEIEDESIKSTRYQSYRTLTHKVNPKWKTEDHNAVTQLKAAAKAVFIDIYNESFTVIDALYDSVRMPVINAKTHQVVLDKSGRIMFQRDDEGNFREDWSLLTGQDIDTTLLKLSQLKLETSSRTKERFMEAIFAKYSFDDDWHQVYDRPLDGNRTHS